MQGRWQADKEAKDNVRDERGGGVGDGGGGGGGGVTLSLIVWCRWGQQGRTGVRVGGREYKSHLSHTHIHVRIHAICMASSWSSLGTCVINYRIVCRRHEHVKMQGFLTTHYRNTSELRRLR